MDVEFYKILFCICQGKMCVWVSVGVLVLKWGIISIWFSNIKLSFLSLESYLLFFFLQSKTLFFPQEAVLILYIHKKLWFSIGIFRVLVWKRGRFLRFILLDWVTFARSNGSFRVGIFTFLPQLSLAHFRPFHWIVGGKVRRTRCERGSIESIGLLVPGQDLNDSLSARRGAWTGLGVSN